MNRNAPRSWPKNLEGPAEVAVVAPGGRRTEVNFEAEPARQRYARARVTVVVPAWGWYARDPLDKVLVSLRSQQGEVRILIVDNASDAAVEPRDGVEILRSEKRVTLGAARNLGLAHVDSEFVVFWDADDVMLAGTLRFLCQRLASHPDYVAWGLSIIEAETGQRHRWPRRCVSRLHRFPRLFAFLNCIWAMYPTTGTTLMRTDAVKATGGFADTDSGDDWALGASLLFRGRVGWDERPGRLYSSTPDSIWARHSTPRHLMAHAASVRRRTRADQAVPRWAKVALPVIALAQLLAILVAAVHSHGFWGALMSMRRRIGTRMSSRHPQEPLPTSYVVRKRVSGVDLSLLIATEEGRLWYDPEASRHTRRWDALELHYARSLELLEPGGVVYDVGANHGVMALFFAMQVGPSGQVYAFDPLAQNVDIIRRNAELNGLSNIDAVQAAVGDASGSHTFDCDNCSVVSDGQAHPRGIGAGRLVTLPSLRLDDFEGSPPTLLKIDVEGFEAAVLRGAQEILKHKPHIYLELHPSFSLERYGESVDDVVGLIDWQDYSLFAARPQSGYVLERWETGRRLVEPGQTSGVWLFARHGHRAGSPAG